MGRLRKSAHPDDLTTREQEVLELVRLGLTNPQIAARLGISLETVKHHVSEVLAKLGVNRREEVAGVTWVPRRRMWLAALPLIAKAAGVGIVLAAVAGLALLALGVARTGDGSETRNASAFAVCARDPDWARPSVDRQAERIRSDPRYNGFDANEQRAFDARFWRDTDSASGQGRTYLLSGLWTSRTYLSGSVCPNPDISHLGLSLLGYSAETVSVAENEVRVEVSEANGFEMIQVRIPTGTFATQIPVAIVDRAGSEIGWIGSMEMASGAGVTFQVCASDPNWVQPSFDYVFSDKYQMFYYIRGVDRIGARATYERHIYMFGAGASVNQFWSGISGLNMAGVDVPGCPTVREVIEAAGRTALFALIDYEPMSVDLEDNTVTVQLRRATGWRVMIVHLGRPLTGGSFRFVSDSGEIIVECHSVGCDS